MGRARRTALLVAGGLVALTALGACTSGESGGAGSAGGGGEQAGPPAAARPAAGAHAPAAQPAGGGDVAVTTGLHIATAKIQIAHMTVAVRHKNQVAVRADAANDIATRAGGEVDADDRSAGRHPTATLVLKVPPAALTRVLSELSGLGHETSRTLSTRDVTSKVADVNSRVLSAQKAIDRLRKLYTQAVKVRNVIAIEQELSSREADLESLEAQQRALAGETSYATITLTLVVARKHVTAPPAKHTHGFVGGVLAGWHAFVRGAGWLATALGAVLPFAALLLVLALIARTLRRRSTRHVPSE